MSGYSLDRVPRIVQGADLIDRLGEQVRALAGEGARALLVADPGLAAAGIIARAEAALAASQVPFTLVTELKSDPTCAQVDAAAAQARDVGAHVVVALGGGSALDVGKAVAAVAAGDAPAVAYQLCETPLPVRPLAKICVPTTSGTGSETTRVSVLSRDDGTKVWLWGDALKADLVLLDPALTVGLPPGLTAATGIDALVHAIEAATSVNASAGNNVYAHAAIALVARNLLQAVDHPGDLEARAALQLAAALAGIAIDNAGTAIAHTIGHALASLRPVHHGRAVGLAMLATLAWNVQEDDGRFMAVSAAMGHVSALALPDAFETLLRRSGVKVSLAGEGYDHVTPAALAAKMAAPENAPMRRSNRRPVGDDDLLRFAETVLTQV